jgi:hypothetical protein
MTCSIWSQQEEEHEKAEVINGHTHIAVTLDLFYNSDSHKNRNKIVKTFSFMVIGSPAFMTSRISYMNTVIDIFIETIHALDPQIVAAYSRQEIVHYTFVILSRAFRLKGPGTPLVLIPIADLFNHDHVRPTVLLHESEDVIFFPVTVAGVQRGEELFSDYGIDNNYKALFFFGFVVENDPDMDVAEVFFEDPSIFFGDSGEVISLPGRGGGGGGRARHVYRVELRLTEESRREGLGTLRRLVGGGEERQTTLFPDVTGAGAEGGAEGSRGGETPRLGDTTRRKCCSSSLRCASRD